MIIILVFITGLVMADNNLLPSFIISSNVGTYVLYLLMFVVGISIGSDKEALSVLKKVNWKIMLIPLSIIAGSLGATAVYAYVSQALTVKEAMSVGAGFGYYSLSSILISDLYSESLGTVALIANIIRELFTLLFSPLLVLLFGKLAPIASGGATSMDSTLPIIVKSSGKEYGLLAIFSGILLTILVPFIVSFIIS